MTYNDPAGRTDISPEPVVEPTPEAAPVAPPVAARQTTNVTAAPGPGGAEMGRRIVILLFGLVQVVIGLRVLLLLLDAREGNAIVSGILDISQLFVGPFEGMLNTNALASGGSILDLAAIVAFVGWTVLELIVLWALGVFRREPA